MSKRVCKDDQIRLIIPVIVIITQERSDMLSVQS